jgi:hypothetical protein
VYRIKSHTRHGHRQTRNCYSDPIPNGNADGNYAAFCQTLSYCEALLSDPLQVTIQALKIWSLIGTIAEPVQ